MVDDYTAGDHDTETLLTSCQDMTESVLIIQFCIRLISTHLVYAWNLAEEP